ncbi:lipoprotein-34 [Pistricoccus aurantiacus]|uniref:lipoprotein-34 n=1 Tax=Pistricoccus aurantiacus TaxID=1883414 RepID=UPI00362F7397
MNPSLKWPPLVVLLILTGCARDGYYDDRSQDYTNAQSVAPLTLPQGRDVSRYQPVMPVPEANGSFQAQQDFEVPRPNTTGAGAGAQALVERRSLGGDQWLVVKDSPRTVWRQLNDFSRRQGLEVTQQDAERGTLYTTQGTLSVQSGLGRDVSEVRCEQSGQVAENCLAALESFLGAQGQTATASTFTQRPAAGAADPVRVERRGGDWRMIVDASPRSTWAELDYQLQESFNQPGRQQLVDKNPEAGEFLIEYLPQEGRERGFFGTLFSLGSDESRRLRVALEESGNQTLVSVVSADDEPLSADQTGEILKRLATLLR